MATDPEITKKNLRTLTPSELQCVRYSAEGLVQPPYVPDSSVFTPGPRLDGKLRLGMIGKINFYWHHKRFEYIAEIVSRLGKQFEFQIVGQGNGLEQCRHYLSNYAIPNLVWRPFVAPWEMPMLLNQFDGVFVLETQMPHPVVSNLAMEAMATGVGIITDRVDFASTYSHLFDLCPDDLLVIPASDARVAAEKIGIWILERRRRSPRQAPRQLISYDRYLSVNEDLYEQILAVD